MSRETRAGDVFWYRDSWGIPTKMEVDFVDENSNRIIGKNDRNAFVVGRSDQFVKTLDDFRTSSLRGLFAALCCGLLTISGCALSVPSGPATPNKPDTPTVETVDSAAVFNALADAIEHKTCRDTITLARVVLVHQKNGWLDAAGVKAFDAAFPDAATKLRDLTDADSKTLRGLK